MISKKSMIGTTIIWLTSTLIILFIAIIIFGIIATIGKSPKTTSQESNSIFAEKSYMAYSILNKQIDGRRVDEILLSDLSSSQKEEILSKITPIGTGRVELELLSKEDMEDIDMLDVVGMQKKTVFPLVSDKKLNVQISFEDYFK